MSREREGDPPTDPGAAPRDEGDAAPEQIFAEDRGAIGGHLEDTLLPPHMKYTGTPRATMAKPGQVVALR